jgi:hypothetical protein
MPHSSGGAVASSARAAPTESAMIRRQVACTARIVRTRRARAISAYAITSPTPRRPTTPPSAGAMHGAGIRARLPAKNPRVKSGAVRFVCFGDIHMALRPIERMAPVLAGADAAILTGDLTNFGDPPDAFRVVDAVRAHCPTVWAVTGNLDMAWVIDAFRDAGISLHGEARGSATSASSAAAARTSRRWTRRPSSRSTRSPTVWSAPTPPSATRPAAS